ncbi:hypothetical protein BDV97DRAFT_66046 [Delphinella strobiligena]|nr:hypothetical protein BDV97DRAFT_66046 [Delphinella strobiligena]
MQTPKGCDLALWRCDAVPDRIVLVLEPSSSHIGRWNNETNCKGDELIPVSLFSDGSQPEGAVGRMSTVACAFRHLHASVRLHFREPQEFCDFFSLMTHQRILPEPDHSFSRHSSRHNLRAQKCELTESHRFSRTPTKPTSVYQHCRVQVWNTLSEDRYKVRPTQL